MKYLKQKLMAAAAMLMVSVVMLTSASYAWFTISVTPEVTDITTTITANENFEIALGTNATKKPETTTTTDGANTDLRDKDQTWGATIISLTDLAGLGPAKVEDDVIKTVKYAEDGRPEEMVAATRALVGTTPTTIDDGIADIKDLEGNVIGKTILVWLRTNVAGNVTATVSDLELKTFNDTDRTSLIKIAFERCTYTTTVVEGSSIVVTDSTTTSQSLGAFDANVEVPVLIHVYLDGDAVNNSDIADEYVATIGKIEFSNANIVADNAYDHTVQNP